MEQVWFEMREVAGWVHDDVYKPADVYWAKDGSALGVHLVLDQRGNLLEHAECHRIAHEYVS